MATQIILEPAEWLQYSAYVLRSESALVPGICVLARRLAQRHPAPRSDALSLDSIRETEKKALKFNKKKMLYRGSLFKSYVLFIEKLL